MRVFLYEMSGGGGFGNYCKNLSQALGRIQGKGSIFVNTVKQNTIYKDKDINISLIDNLKSLTSGISKKNIVVWIINRVFVTAFNAVVRTTNISRIKPDVVNINQIIPVIDQFFLNFIKKKSIIVITVHDVIPPVKSFYWSYKSLKKVYGIADYLIVHSEENRELLMRRFKINRSKIKVIEHGVEIDNNELNQKECRHFLNLKDEFVLLFFGSIRESKGLEILIEAMKDLNGCMLLVAGPMIHGESFDRYCNLLKKYNIKSYINIEYVSDDLVPVYFKASDLVVLPYKEFYSQSGVLMQAITYRKAVIATDVSGFKNFIEKYDFGEVVPPGNIPELRKAIKELYFNRDIVRTYESNVVKAYKELNWVEISKKHIEFYKEILSRR